MSSPRSRSNPRTLESADVANPLEESFYLVRASIAKSAIEEYSRSFSEKLEALVFEQKRILVDMLVDRVEVTETDKEMRLKVVFKFAQPKRSGDSLVGEPENTIKTEKNASDEDFSSVVGRPNSDDCRILVDSIEEIELAVEQLGVIAKPLLAQGFTSEA